MKRLLIVFLAVVMHAPVALAQEQTDRRQNDAKRQAQLKAIDAKIHERWAAILAETARSQGATLTGKTLSASPEQKAAIYRAAILRMADDPALLDIAKPDRSLVDEVATAEARKFVGDMQKSGAEDAHPKSLSATSTNPVTAGMSEHSGFAELLAVALNSQNIVSADGTAVSISLNALALTSLADPNVYSELYRYQQHSALRRLGGTVTFGAKIPAKEITGLSGVPDADKLLDAIGWDIKVRLLGDKDPRSSQWYDLTLGRQALFGQMEAVLLSELDPAAPEDILILKGVAEEIGKRNLAEIKRRINRSPQLTFKTAGTHLTEETGKNKYTAALLFDVGMASDTAVTANLLYSVADDVSLGASKLFQVKQLTFSASVTTHFARDVIVKGRSVEWTSGTTVNSFVNKASLPIPVQNTWKVFTNFEIPWLDAAKIPISVVYTNDANALKKTQYVKGLVGVSYDFSALKKLFQ